MKIIKNFEGTGPGKTVLPLKSNQAGEADVHFGNQTGNMFTITPSISTKAFQTLLDGAPAGAVITMTAGVYEIDDGLEISRNDITLQGAGVGETILKTLIPDEDASSTLLVQPDAMTRKIGKIAQDAQAGSRTITLKEGHGLVAGDILYIAQSNDAKFLEESGNAGWDMPGENPRYYLREQHSGILSVEGNVVTLKEPLAYSFETDKADTAESIFLSGIHLKGFTIEGNFGTPDPFAFTNTQPDWMSIRALSLDGVTNSSLSDITVLNPASHAFGFQRNYGVIGDNLTAIGAMNKGNGSNGYHFYLSESFSNTLTNLHSEGSRHSVLTSSASAEHYNTIHVKFTDRDINFHGSPDADNTIVVDRQVMDYPAGSTPQWSAVHPGASPLHPESTIEKNDVTFRFARTGDRNDRIVAHQDGGDIATGNGNDRITGGEGQDTLDGGSGNDILRGEGGHDRLYGSEGDDLIFGGTGRDSLYGGSGNDTLWGDEGPDFVSAGDGDDIVHGGAGDVVQLGQGEDRLVMSLDEPFAQPLILQDYKASDLILIRKQEAGALIALYAHDEAGNLIITGEDRSPLLVIRANETKEFFLSSVQGPDTFLYDGGIHEGNLYQEGLAAAGVRDPDAITLTEPVMPADSPAIEPPVVSPPIPEPESPSPDPDEEEDDEEDPQDKSSGSGGPCFVATAAYGSRSHPDVVAMRRLRDDVLIRYRAGRAFVRIYWAIGPWMAKHTKPATRRGAAARGIVKAVLRLSRLGIAVSRR